LKERTKLTRITARKYRLSCKKEKSKILDTFIAQTGYGRKYAIHILANEGRVKFLKKNLKVTITHKTKPKRIYPVIYDADVLSALTPIWEAFNYQCGKLLAPFIHANIDRIARDTHFSCSAEVRAKLRTISAATIDRLLKKTKEKMRVKGTAGTKPAKGHIKSLIPVMSHFECKDYGPGVWQIDLVQHDGGNPSGEFCSTLTITEVATPWTVHFALRNKAFKWVHEALNTAFNTLPLPVLVLHPDNGSEFINHALVAWCAQKRITLKRSRGNTKNDNCFVEQKNWASVRKITGYMRLFCEKGVYSLQRFSTHYDKLLNYFYPCQKLLSKERIGSKVKKKYDKPAPPFDRALKSSGFSGETKKYLRAEKKRINLMAEMRRMQTALDRLPSFAEPVPALFPKGGPKPLRFGSLSLGSIF
jgi:hypothetical protein